MVQSHPWMLLSAGIFCRQAFVSRDFFFSSGKVEGLVATRCRLATLRPTFDELLIENWRQYDCKMIELQLMAMSSSTDSLARPSMTGKILWVVLKQRTLISSCSACECIIQMWQLHFVCVSFFSLWNNEAAVRLVVVSHARQSMWSLQKLQGYLFICHISCGGDLWINLQNIVPVFVSSKTKTKEKPSTSMFPIFFLPFFLLPPVL